MSRVWPTCVAAVLTALVCASPAAGAESTRDWTQRALALQYELASDVPLRNAPWVFTHNSYNSQAEMGPTRSNLDAGVSTSACACRSGHAPGGCACATATAGGGAA